MAPATVSLRVHPGRAQRLEGAQQDRQALASVGAADEQQLERTVAGLVMGRHRRRQIHAVGHDPVAPAIEALAGPARGLGHGDAHVELAVEAARARDVRRDPVGEPVARIAVEGPNQGHARGLGGEPAHERSVGLVHMDDVVAAVAQLAPERSHGLARQGEVRDRAVRREPDGATERDQVIGQGATIRRGAAMHDTCQAVVGVVRGE